MIRPTVYLGISRLVTAAVLLLFWDRFINVYDYYDPVTDGSLVCAVFFLACAWFQYLSLDHVYFFSVSRKEKKKIKKHWKADIADFADEKVISLEELEPEERKSCRFISHTVCCVICFLIFGIASLVR